ncbi:MAG: hypothetical protein AB1500_00860 [Bacillota bacterium]
MPGGINDEESVSVRSKNFFEKAEENPCNGCSAPCCRLLLIPHPTPGTYMDLDYIRYMIGFESVRVILNSDGQWQVLIERTCRLFNEETNLCTVHDTARKPKTCVFFNPHRCWYKRSFESKDAPGLIRIDMEGLEAILTHIRFDEEGNIIEIPTWEVMRALVNNKGCAPDSKPPAVSRNVVGEIGLVPVENPGAQPQKEEVVAGV